MGHSSAANRGIIFDSKQEGTHEDKDRAWRRWQGFCRASGKHTDPFLTDLSPRERDVYAKSFVQCYRTADWTVDGDLKGIRERNLATSTLRTATGHVAATFRDHFKPSPFHVEGSTNLRNQINELCRSYENVDPLPEKQKAITPKLLRSMFKLSGVGLPPFHDQTFAVVTELAIFGFFFAMRSCENTTPPKPGKTKLINLGGLVFRDSLKRQIPHDHPGLGTAEYITPTFEDQKNAEKNDKRTQRRTPHIDLCPVKRAASLVHRIHKLVPGYDLATTLNTIQIDGRVARLTQNYLRDQLRATCIAGGGKAVFGFDSHEIGTRSIRSGAAMGLFLMNHSSDKIMILGRWKSKSFMEYIRPQVLEWTNNMSTDMTRFESFLDTAQGPAPHLARNRTRFNGRDNDSSTIIPRLHLNH
jgi:hypothetical protein